MATFTLNLLEGKPHLFDQTFALAGSGVSVGDPIGSGTAGSVLFVDASSDLAQDNANLFWNDTSNYLRVPRIAGSDSASGNLRLSSTSHGTLGNIAFDVVYLQHNSTGSQLAFPDTGEFQILTDDALGFGALILGPESSDGVRIDFENGTEVAFRRGDDVEYADIRVDDITTFGNVKAQNDVLQASVLSWGLRSTGLTFGSAKQILWSASTVETGAKDLGMERDSVNTLKITDGSTGLGDLIAGNITASSLVVPVTISGTLSDPTGDEYALNIEYTVNKATSGDDYGLRIVQTDTASPGTSYLLWAGVGSTSQFNVTNAGVVTSNGNYVAPDTAQFTWASGDAGLLYGGAGVVYCTDGGSGSGTIAPQTPLGANLGSSSRRWADVYCRSLLTGTNLTQVRGGAHSVADFWARGSDKGATVISEISSFHDENDFTQTSGSNAFSSLLIDGEIDQSGGGSGITRGIHVAHTVTNAADYRAIEVDSGDIVLSATSFVRHSVTAGITASTTQTQGQQPLTSEVNEVSTCANANDTVTLPSAIAGLWVTIINNGAQTLQVFPASGDDLGAGVDTATTIGAGAHKKWISYDGTNFFDIT